MSNRVSPITTGDYDNDKLITKMWRAITRQLDRDQRGDVVNHGMAGGFPGFTYYTDTNKFYRKHEDAIFALIAHEAEQHGYNNIFAFLADTNGQADDPVTMKNHMVWVAVEIMCQAEQYQDED